MNKNNNVSIKNILYPILFLVFGIIMLTSNEGIFGLASKIIGTIFFVVGIIKCIIYIYNEGKTGEHKTNDLVISLLIMGSGIILIICSSALNFAIRTIIGLWTLIAGINKIIIGFSIRENDTTGFRIFFGTAFIMIVVGILLLSGLSDRLISILIIIYSITEIVDYIYFRVKHKNYEQPIKKSIKKKSIIKSDKVVDAIVEENNK